MTPTTSNMLFAIAFGLYLVAMVASFLQMARVSASPERRRDVASWTGSGTALLTSVVTVAGVAVHASSVVVRAVAAGRVPLGNMYEYGSAIALVAVLVGVVLLRREHAHLVGFVIAAALLMMTSSLLLFTEPGPLVPALESYWLQIHVSAMMLSSAIFIVAFVATALYLVKDTAERRVAATDTFAGSTVGAARLATVAPPTSGAGVERPTSEAVFADARAQRDVLAAWPFPTIPFLSTVAFVGVVWRQPVAAMTAASVAAIIGAGAWYAIPHMAPAAALDRLAHRTSAFAFPIITFGIMCGAIWAEEAWGRYWGWDPKETGSFFTWLLYAAYLHARVTHGWRGRRAAWVGVVAFVALLVTYYAVNLFVVGLHSYAGI